MDMEFTRRVALKRLALGTAGVALGGNLLAACGSDSASGGGGGDSEARSRSGS
jgi:hypothetical protein